MASYEGILPAECEFQIIETKKDRDPAGQTDGVYVVRSKKTTDTKILKYFYSDKFGPSNPNEVGVASTLSHPNIISSNMLVNHSDCHVKGLGEIMDFAQVDYIEYIGSLVTLEQKLSSMLKILYGIQFMHRQGYLHLDIKYDNIVILNGVESITDFGNAVRCSDVREGVVLNLESLGGTLTYISPEIYKKDPKGPIRYNSAVDVWALGHLFFAVLFGRTVHPNELYNRFREVSGRAEIFRISDMLTNADYVANRINEAGNGMYTEQVLKLFITLFSRIWSKEPSTRPSVTQIISFPLFDLIRGQTPAPEGTVFQMGIKGTSQELVDINQYIILLLGMANKFGLTKLPIVVLFTAIDLYYRTYHSVRSVNQAKVKSDLAYACFYISLRAHTLRDYNIYSKILQLANVDVEYFSQMISDIYIIVRGDINRYSYFQLCNGTNHLKYLLSNYILKSSVYIASDFVKFKQELSNIPPEGKVDISIGDFSTYIRSK